MLKLGKDDFLLVTFDTLRFDVASEAWQTGLTPNLASWLPHGGWERRYSPATFTYAAHAAFFAGFFPTPAKPGKHPRALGVQFLGSETLTADAVVFDAPDIVSGFRAADYRTICIGGVGFFNKQNPLGNVLPNLFDESYWSPDLGVTNYHSAERQIELAVDRLRSVDSGQRIFLFINLSAMHQPNCHYVAGQTEDSAKTQMAALQYVDTQWTKLMDALLQRGSGAGILCSDHGTAYGEDGYVGHRLAHPVVLEVPYAEIGWGDRRFVTATATASRTR